MDGYQVVSALRAALPEPLPCFVATTGYGRTDEPETASEAGFRHYLVKPISMAALTRIIASHWTPLRASRQPRDDGDILTVPQEKY